MAINERLETIFNALTEENKDTLILVAKGIEVGQEQGKKSKEKEGD